MGSVNAQTPNYFGNNPAWSAGFWCSGGMGCEWPPYTMGFQDQIVYYTDGLEILGSETYYKIRKKTYRYSYTFGPDPDEILDVFEIYVRQEGRAIYYYESSTGQDSLLVSYDLNIGDSFGGRFGVDNSSLQVEVIDSILVGGNYRIIIYVDTLLNKSVVEGIGYLSQYNGANNAGDYFGLGGFFGGGLGFEYSLNCYGENNLPLWNSLIGGGCQITLDNPELENNIQIEIFPNPVNDILKIRAENDEIQSIAIMNLQGQIVVELSVDQSSNEVDVSHLESGVYLVSILTFKGNIVRKQITRL